MRNDPVSIVTSVEDYIKWIHQEFCAGGRLAFRGQRDASWKLDCSAARRISEFNDRYDKIWDELMVQYHRATLIRPARKYGFAVSGGKELGDLEILAKLQHLGAATCLLDFTRDALIALWMACELVDSSQQESNGKVFAIDLSETKTFREVALSEAQIKDNISEYLIRTSEASRNSMCWYWEPPMVPEIAPRLLRQHSIFLLGHAIFPDDIVKSIEIHKDHKEYVLKVLSSNHNLSSESLYPDVFGFSTANGQASKLKPVLTFDGHISDGSSAFEEANYREAVNSFSEASSLRPNDASVYFRRAYAHAALGLSSNVDEGECRAALSDYDRAIDSIHQDDFNTTKNARMLSIIAYNRGNLFSLVREFDRAIEEFDRCMSLNENSGHPTRSRSFAHFNRASLYFSSGKFREAIEDYRKALTGDIEANHKSNVYYNLGNSCAGMRMYSKAIDFYNQSLGLITDRKDALRNRAWSRVFSDDESTGLSELEKLFGDLNTLKNVRAVLASRCDSGGVELKIMFQGIVGNIGSIGMFGLPAGAGHPGGRAFPNAWEIKSGDSSDRGSPETRSRLEMPSGE